jgi:hypothetical protein
LDEAIEVLMKILGCWVMDYVSWVDGVNGCDFYGLWKRFCMDGLWILMGGLWIWIIGGLLREYGWAMKPNVFPILKLF